MTFSTGQSGAADGPRFRCCSTDSRRGSGGFELHETERVSGRVGVDPVGFVLEHDPFRERDRPRRAPAARRSRGRRPAHPGEAAAVAPGPASRAGGNRRSAGTPGVVGRRRRPRCRPRRRSPAPAPSRGRPPRTGRRCRRPGSPRRCSSAGRQGCPPGDHSRSHLLPGCGHKSENLRAVAQAVSAVTAG
jgi:hypothetical protein